MTSTLEAPTTALPTIDEANAAIAATLAILPDEERSPDLSPFRREQIGQGRARLHDLRTEIALAQSYVTDYESREPETAQWPEEDGPAVRARLTEKFLAADPRTVTGRENTRMQQQRGDISLGLLCLDKGAQMLGTSYNLGVALHETMIELGLQPLPGQTSLWAGRGSLPAAERRQADLRARIVEARARLDRSLASVDAVVAFAKAAANS